MANKNTEIYNYIAKLYQTSLKVQAEQLEEKRKKYVLIHKLATVLFFGSIIAWVLSFVLMYFAGKNAAIGSVCFAIMLIGAPLIIITGLLRSGILVYYRHNVKTKLFTKIYHALDTNLKYTPGGFKLPVKYYEIEMVLKLVNIIKDKSGVALSSEDIIKSLSPLLPRYDHIRIDDVISGFYQGRRVNIIEFSLIDREIDYDKNGRRKVDYREIFHGALFQTTMEKQVNTNVFIEQRGSKLRCPHGLEKVSLESSEFAKIYEVFSNDQIEARYFLTTSTMENLIDLNNSGQKISGYINGKDVNLIIHTSEDMFEPDINKPLDNINNYVDLIFQVKIILDMITKLKLESKTGL